MRKCESMVTKRKRIAADTQARVIATIKDLAKRGEPLTIANIARHCHVSRVYLYKNAEIIDAIEKERACPVAHTTDALLRRCAELEQKLATAQARCHHLEFKRKMLEIELELMRQKRSNL